ncbi:hypothetical protein Dimus_014716 [Dionaea muscipula]
MLRLQSMPMNTQYSLLMYHLRSSKRIGLMAIGFQAQAELIKEEQSKFFLKLSFHKEPFSCTNTKLIPYRQKKRKANPIDFHHHACLLACSPLIPSKPSMCFCFT